MSRINEQTYFSITPIPIFILNNQPPSDDACDGSTKPEPQPQQSSPPPEQPFLGSGFSLTTGFSQPAAPTNTGSETQDTVTVTLTRTIVSTISTIVTATQTLSLSSGGFTTVTVYVHLTRNVITIDLGLAERLLTYITSQGRSHPFTYHSCFCLHNGLDLRLIHSYQCWLSLDCSSGPSCFYCSGDFARVHPGNTIVGLAPHLFLRSFCLELPSTTFQ